MHELTRTPKTDPVAIYRHRDALYATDLLVAALKGLDFFTWIAAQPQTLEGICQHFGFHERPVEVMTTYFVASGWLHRNGGEFSATETAREHLVNGSNWFLGPYFPKVSDRPIAGDFLECLKSGKPANFASRKDHGDWHKAMETDAFATEFTAMMDCRGVLLAQALAKNLNLSGRRRLLDIAGGSGVYACSLCAHHPDLTATVLDKSPVDRIAARSIAERGFDRRVDVVASDMMEAPLPKGYDVHLFSNVLHDWDTQDVQTLIRASADSIEPGGLMIVHDAFLNADKSGPLHVAEYSVALMHITQGRCYSEKEIADWAQAAGFELIQKVPSAAMRSALVLKRV